MVRCAAQKCPRAALSLPKLPVTFRRMRLLQTLQAVPPPSFHAVFPRLVLLGVFAVFETRTPVLAGHAVSPLSLAALTFWILTLTRQRLFALPALAPDRRVLAGRVNLVAYCIIPFILFLPSQSLQTVWVCFSFAFVMAQMLFLWLFPEDAEGLPVGSSFTGEEAERVARVRVASWSVYVMMSSAFAVFGSLADWVLFVTLGQIIWAFANRWIIVLMIFAGDLDVD